MGSRTLSALILLAPLFASDSFASDLSDLIEKAPRLPVGIVRLPIEVEVGFPSSVTVGRDGLVYILHRGENTDPVIVASRQGTVLRSWGKGMYKIPHSIRIGPDGNVWTVDASSSMIYQFTPQGQKLMEIAVGGQPPTKSAFNGTTDIAFAPNGRIFISDGYGNARILEYTAEGKRVREWGIAGTAPGQFRQPHGIAVDEKGVIYVADRQNGRLQRFDLAGKFLGEWDNLGMVTSVTYRNGSLYIGTQERSEPTSADGWFLKLDRDSGKILGWIPSNHSQHMINVTADGELFSGARPDSVFWFHRLD